MQIAKKSVFFAVAAAVFLSFACSSDDETGGKTATVDAGTSCDDVSDCSDPTSMVCDPISAKCVPGQCSDSVGCAAGGFCKLQQANATVGACYVGCIFNGSPCPDGATCRVTPNDNTGYCWGAGSAKEGQACQQADLNTGCAPGLICATDQGQRVCRNQCSYWSTAPGCPSGQHCATSSLCFTQQGDPAAIGEPCASGASAGEPCGSESGAWRGSCVSSGAGYVCTKVCRIAVSVDCPTDKTCQVAAGDDLGLCL